jgi:integrase
MAIIKQKSGTYQARIQDRNGRILSCVFRTKSEAEAQERKWKDQKKHGAMGGNLSKQLTLDEFFAEWFFDLKAETRANHCSGWRTLQLRLYQRHVSPLLGTYRMHDINPQMVKRVLSEMATKGLAEATQYHVFSLLRKMFRDAIENYQYLTFNPVLRKIKPRIPLKEARHLRVDQIQKLLVHVQHRPYGLAIWIQFYMGLRVGELQALRWEDIDLETGRLSIRRTFIRKTNLFRDYPKGRRQHSNTIPPELREELKGVVKSPLSELIVISKHGNILPYRWYMHALRGYCRELGFPPIGTHGLRHSTSELYLNHGASRDDLRRLFAHSSSSVTDRYIHDRGTSLERISTVVRLFPVGIDQKSTNLEKTGNQSKVGGVLTV